MANHDTDHGPCECGAWHYRETPRSPFPPEVVERAACAIYDIDPMYRRVNGATRLVEWADLHPGGQDEYRSLAAAGLSVVADYLQSEEARERAIEAIDDLTVYDGLSSAAYADAVIAALLNEAP